MEIRNSTQENLHDIMKLIHQAQNYFKNANIDQWQDGYPNEETILEDIAQNNSYVLIENNHVIATMFLSFDGEPTYTHIDGQWLTETPYARIDTHNDNHSMQKFLYKNGFALCGNIILKSGAPRIAFEKILA